MIRTGRKLAAAALAASLLFLPAASAAASAALPVRAASAVLRDANGATVGWALFTDAGQSGVQVVVVTTGIPAGLHGMHVHTIGSCIAPSFTSAGAHFNPLGTNHGSHAGDLPNLPVGPGGLGIIFTTTTHFTLAPGQLSVFDGDGSALVIHAKEDDYVTNPTGNSGARIACGVINPIGFGILGLSRS